MSNDQNEDGSAQSSSAVAESYGATDEHNTPYTIKVSSPLLREGMEIKAGPVSERYVTDTVRKLMDMVREVNEA